MEKKRKQLDFSKVFLPGCGRINGPSGICVMPKRRKTTMTATSPLKIRKKVVIKS